MARDESIKRTHTIWMDQFTIELFAAHEQLRLKPEVGLDSRR